MLGFTRCSVLGFHTMQRACSRRKKHVYGPAAEDIIKRAKNKVRTGEHAAMIRAIHTEVLLLTLAASSNLPSVRISAPQQRHAAELLSIAASNSSSKLPYSAVWQYLPLNSCGVYNVVSLVCSVSIVAVGLIGRGSRQVLRLCRHHWRLLAPDHLLLSKSRPFSSKYFISNLPVISRMCT